MNLHHPGATFQNALYTPRRLERLRWRTSICFVGLGAMVRLCVGMHRSVPAYSRQFGALGCSDSVRDAESPSNSCIQQILYYDSLRSNCHRTHFFIVAKKALILIRKFQSVRQLTRNLYFTDVCDVYDNAVHSSSSIVHSKSPNF